LNNESHTTTNGIIFKINIINFTTKFMEKYFFPVNAIKVLTEKTKRMKSKKQIKTEKNVDEGKNSNVIKLVTTTLILGGTLNTRVTIKNNAKM